MPSSVASQNLTWLTALWAEGFLSSLQVRKHVEKVKGQKAARIVGDEELVELGEEVARSNLIEMSRWSNWVLPITWKQTLLSGARQCNKGQWLETISWKVYMRHKGRCSWEDWNLGSGAWTPCEISVLWEFEDSARQSCGWWCSERCPCPGQEDWIRWFLKVPLDLCHLWTNPAHSVKESCYSLCSCWAKGWPGNQRILPVWFWDFFNF